MSIDTALLATKYPGLLLTNLTEPDLTLIMTKDLPNHDSEWFKITPDYIEFVSQSRGDVDHTKNSTFARCETRETHADGTLHNWKRNDFPLNKLAYSLAVMSHGIDGKIIIGQIHDEDDHPVCKLQWNNHSIVKQFIVQQDGDESKVTLAENIPFGQYFDLSIALEDGEVLTIGLDGKESSQELDGESYDGSGMYFKLGNYLQTKVAQLNPQGKPWTDAEIAASRGVVRVKCFAITHGDHPKPIPTLTLAEQIKLDIDAVMIAYKATHAPTSADRTKALTDLNDLSKKVAGIPVDTDRAPLYAEIKMLKAQI